MTVLAWPYKDKKILLPIPAKELMMQEVKKWSRSVMSDSLQPHGL